jgi:DNA-binding GntR family transcriptional regulator
MNSDPRAYMRLAALLEDQITSGQLSKGQPMPNIGKLRADHGHSRQTVGKALTILEAKGLVCRVTGLGYFVNDE